jgi:hypothetical protein
MLIKRIEDIRVGGQKVESFALRESFGLRPSLRSFNSHYYNNNLMTTNDY